MKKLIDLHTHTTASDGVYSPRDLVKKAKDAGLTALGIADHDTINGLKEGLAAGKEFDFEVVPGMEITSYYTKQNRREFHILGYYMDLENEELIRVLDHYQTVREDRAKKIVGKLNELGFDISFDRVRAIAGGTIGKPHITRVILENSLNVEKLTEIFQKVPDISTFIQMYLNAGKPAYVEKAGMEPEETINFIHRVGGVAVLAHPGWDLRQEETDIIKKFVDWEVDGLEAIHSKKTKEDTVQNMPGFIKIAKEYNLLITGGSDFHADRKGEPGAELGMMNWGIDIDYELLAKLKAKAS